MLSGILFRNQLKDINIYDHNDNVLLIILEIVIFANVMTIQQINQFIPLNIIDLWNYWKDYCVCYEYIKNIPINFDVVLLHIFVKDVEKGILILCDDIGCKYFYNLINIMKAKILKINWWEAYTIKVGDIIEIEKCKFPMEKYYTTKETVWNENWKPVFSKDDLEILE